MIEVYDPGKSGFTQLMHSDEWQVCTITYGPQYSIEGFDHLKRHMKTDEVICLVKGNAVIHTVNDAGKLETVPVDLHKIYCIRKKVWHYLEISEDALLIVVENAVVLPKDSERMERECLQQN